MTLFDHEKPKPGQCCPTCGLIVPLPLALKTGRKHPATSHLAAAKANSKLAERRDAIIALLNSRGMEGATDDEIDAAHPDWKHQVTTSITVVMRDAGLIAWAFDEQGLYRKRKTRKNCWAHVNVSPPYAIYAAGPNERGRKGRRRKADRDDFEKADE